MKALTLWQPWASLIAWGEKRYETRSYGISHRGTLAIHAGLQSDAEALIKLNSFYREAFDRAGIKADLGIELPKGCVLCVVDLLQVQQIKEVDRGIVFEKMLDQKEENFGDYSHGRYAWKLENLRVLAKPIPARGYQGLWDWPVELESLEFKK